MKIAAVAVLLALAGTARAQESADKLFDEGRDLMTKGRASEACPKFEKSQELDPGRGTLINLAACYEAVGKLVKALSTYQEVAKEAGPAGDKPRLQVSNERIAALQARIPHLAIDVGTAPREDGFAVTVAGELVPPAQYGDVLVDPGHLEVTALAPGYDRYQTTIDTADGMHDRVTIPPLVKPKVATVIVPETTIVEHERHRDRTRTIIALGAGGVGLVAFGGSIALSLSAKKSYDNALKNDCNDDASMCNQAGLTATQSARSKGNLATIIGGVGLAAIAGGVVLYFTAPTVETQRTALVPQVSADGAGLAVIGSF